MVTLIVIDVDKEVYVMMMMFSVLTVALTRRRKFQSPPFSDLIGLNAPGMQVPYKEASTSDGGKMHSPRPLFTTEGF